MKRQFSSIILRFGTSLIMSGLVANGPVLRAQQFGTTVSGGPGVPGGVRFGIVINGSDVGTILLKTCDSDKDGKVTRAELEEVILACFKLWDSDTNGIINSDELFAGLKQLFPPPPPGGLRAVHMVNGVAVEVAPGDIPTPDGQVAKHLLAGADSDKDGALTFQEASAFLLDKCFSQWDRDGNASLDAHELNEAFGQLARPD